jgi:tetratricopeptide (TPR) repeat protein
VLVVLDNARDAAQVRPLLPGTAGCLAVATSRSKLTSLIAGEGASPVTLDVLTSGEAADLLARGIGAERAARDPDAARELIESCARLPLALSIAAARAAIRPGVPLAAQAAELRNAQTRLDALNTGEEASSVRAVFSWSCEQLGAPAARMFRLLGLHPGPDISLSAASSLAGVTPREARAALDELTLSSLLTERRPGRYSLHDLLRAYAAELAVGRDGEADRRAAVRRMLDHYLLSANRAATLMDPSRRLGPPPATAPEVIPDQLASQDEALAWCQTEYPVLMRATELAAASRFGRSAWQITWALSGFFFGSVRPEEWQAAGLVALSAAIEAGDRYGQAHMLHGLGGACTALGRYDDARARYAAALEIYEQLGDRSGQARAHIELGLSYEYRERHRDVFGARPAQAGAGQPDSMQPDSMQPDSMQPDSVEADSIQADSAAHQQQALRHARQALALYRAAGDRAGEAGACSSVGRSLALCGEATEAVSYCERAVRINHELGNGFAEAVALISLGYALHKAGRYDDAVPVCQRAVGLCRQIARPRLEAIALTHLGEAHRAAGTTGAARAAWEQALVILDDLDHPDADQVRARLRNPTRR